jgi:hypothetical protein
MNRVKTVWPCVGFGDASHQGNDPGAHPRHVPLGVLGKHTLHVAAQMNTGLRQYAVRQQVGFHGSTVRSSEGGATHLPRFQVRLAVGVAGWSISWIIKRRSGNQHQARHEVTQPDQVWPAFGLANPSCGSRV